MERRDSKPTPNANEEVLEVLPADDLAPRRNRAEPIKLQVRIRHDPAGFLKGNFRGLVTERGLELQQGRKEKILVPVGRPAEVIDKNRLRLTIGERQVEATI